MLPPEFSLYTKLIVSATHDKVGGQRTPYLFIFPVTNDYVSFFCFLPFFVSLRVFGAGGQIYLICVAAVKAIALQLHFQRGLRRSGNERRAGQQSQAPSFHSQAELSAIGPDRTAQGLGKVESSVWAIPEANSCFWEGPAAVPDFRSLVRRDCEASGWWLGLLFWPGLVM